MFIVICNDRKSIPNGTTKSSALIDFVDKHEVDVNLISSINL